MEKIFNIQKLRADVILKRVIQLNINMDKCAELIGTSKATLSRIENAKLPEVETFGKVCVWLEKSPSEYFIIPIKKDEFLTRKPDLHSSKHHSVD